MLNRFAGLSLSTGLVLEHLYLLEAVTGQLRACLPALWAEATLTSALGGVLAFLIVAILRTRTPRALAQRPASVPAVMIASA